MILRMRLDMLLIELLFSEAFIAEIAHVTQGQLVLVEMVPREGFLICKSLVTSGAFERMFGGMIREMILAGERFVADGANIRLESSMQSRMTL
jgi:hypothetical protein